MTRHSERRPFDPEAALRAHFAAELAAERREASCGGKHRSDDPRSLRPRGAEGDSAPVKWRGSTGNRIAESAYAAVLALAVGLSLTGAARIGPLGDTLAETMIQGGKAAAVGSVFGSGFAAAIAGFGALKGADSAENAPRAFGRFK